MLAFSFLVMAQAAPAAGTPLDEFDESIVKKAKKSICVCQDGGSLNTRTGLLATAQYCSSGFCTVSTTCEIQLFNSTTFETGGTVSCATYETIAK
jgi:hypothetical protein